MANNLENMSLEKPLGYLLGHTVRIYKNKLTSKLKENDAELSFEQYMILLQLRAREDLTQQDLANHLQKDKSIILRQINALIEKRYVIRLNDKVDKRKKNLIMTQKGYEALAISKAIAKKLSDELLSGVDSEDLQVFEKVLDVIRQNSGIEEECNNFCTDKQTEKY